MIDVRRVQLEIFRRMTPAERLKLGMEFTARARAARDARLRRQHPHVTEEEFRWIRVREVLGLSHDAPLP